MLVSVKREGTRQAAEQPNGADAPTVPCDPVAAARGSSGTLGGIEATAIRQRKAA